MRKASSKREHNKSSKNRQCREGNFKANQKTTNTIITALRERKPDVTKRIFREQKKHLCNLYSHVKNLTAEIKSSIDGLKLKIRKSSRKYKDENEEITDIKTVELCKKVQHPIGFLQRENREYRGKEIMRDIK